MLLPRIITELSFEDVSRFAERFEEGLRVEYKSDLSDSVKRKVPAIVSAFANSYGGVLIIGIDAPTGRCQSPPEGYALPERDEYSLTIQNLCIAHIDPPVFPRVRQIESQDGTRAFLVIEVDDSLLAPHAIENSRKVYIRTGEAQKPFDLADVATLSRLFRRRELLKEVEKKADQDLLEIAKIYEGVPPRLVCSIRPAFSFPLERTREEVHNYMLQRRLFRPDQIHRLPDGCCGVKRRDDSLGVHLFTRNCQFRALYTLQDSRHVQHMPVDDSGYFPLAWIVGNIKKALQDAGHFFRSINSPGDLRVDVELQGIRLRQFIFGEGFNAFEGRSIFGSIPTFTTADIASFLSNVALVEIFYQLVWPMISSESSVPRDVIEQRIDDLVARGL